MQSQRQQAKTPTKREEATARALCRQYAPEIVKSGPNLARYVDSCWWGYLDDAVIILAAVDDADS